MTMAIPRPRRAPRGRFAALLGARPGPPVRPGDDDPLGLLHSRTDGDEDGPPVVQAPPAGVHLYPLGSRPHAALALPPAGHIEERPAVSRWARLARRGRAVLVALGAAAVAGSAVVLAWVAYVDAESAYLDLRWDPGDALILAVVAVWLTQGLLALRRHTRGRPRRPGRHRPPADRPTPTRPCRCPRTAVVITDAGAGTGDYCPRCGAGLRAAAVHVPRHARSRKGRSR